jgi:hypothetical protein
MMAKQPSDEVRRRVAHVVGHLRSVSEGSGQLDARDAWLTITLAIRELEAALTVLRKSLPTAVLNFNFPKQVAA